MSQHNTDPNFRYPNDNRDSSPGDFDYPSQQEVDPSSQKGDRSYYPNDNGGYYANSNRDNISTIEPINKKHYANSNFNPSSEQSSSPPPVDFSSQSMFISTGSHFTTASTITLENEFTISAFANYSPGLSGTSFFIGDESFQILFSNSGGVAKIKAQNNSSLLIENIINQRVFNHIVIKYSNPTLSLYINNSLVPPGEINLIDLTVNLTNIGYLPGYSSFPGYLDEISILNYAANLSVITNELYNNSGKPKDISSLNAIHWWRMGENKISNTIPDQGLNQTDLTIVETSHSTSTKTP